jgi:hypothetical protein
MSTTQKTFTVSKKEVINALTTETLGCSADEYISKKPITKGAKVSATGAVLRNLASIRKGANKVVLELSKDGFNEVASHNQFAVGALEDLENTYMTLKDAGKRSSVIRKALIAQANETMPSKIEVRVWNPATTTVSA